MTTFLITKIAEASRARSPAPHHARTPHLSPCSHTTLPPRPTLSRPIFDVLYVPVPTASSTEYLSRRAPSSSSWTWGSP